MDVFFVVAFTVLTAIMFVGLVWKASLHFKRVAELKRKGILGSGDSAKEDNQ